MKIENTNLPHWDLSSIYSSSNGIDYKKALKTYENGINSLKNLINLPISDKNFSETLISILTIINKTKALYTSFSSYAYCAYSTDTTNIEYLNNMALIEKKGLLLKETQRSFQQFLTTNSRYLPLFYTSYQQHKNYE